MENALRSTVRSIDPLLPLTQVQTMEQVVSDSEASRRFNTVLISSFAFAAVLLAVLGIYSVIAFSVASRVQEMAIRMTLGSQRSAIVRLVIQSGAKLAAIGCIIGLAGAAAASGLLQIDALRREPLRSAGDDTCGSRRTAARRYSVNIARRFAPHPSIRCKPCAASNNPRSDSELGAPSWDVFLHGWESMIINPPACDKSTRVPGTGYPSRTLSVAKLRSRF